ncbi:unnamed protein product, partial [Meganyctiphanes norvegica]
CGSFAEATNSASTSHFGGDSSKLISLGGTAALHTSTTDLGSRSQKCGASLISDRYLLTAAHCVIDREKYSVSLGRDDLDDSPTPGQTYEIENVIIHPEYEHGKSDYNDIAILQTDRKVEYNKKVWPFCLPNNGQVFRNYMAVEIAGWGNINATYKAPTLHTAYVRILLSADCESKWREHNSVLYDSVIKSSYQQGLTSQVLCAGREGVDACMGDSGGPMTYQNSDGLQNVIGIIGKRVECVETPLHPGFYTNIASYIDWIQDNTGLNRASATSTMPQPSPQHQPTVNAPTRRPVVENNEHPAPAQDVSEGDAADDDGEFSIDADERNYIKNQKRT